MVASKLFNDDDKKAISAAVADAEKKTAGEIVPVVATSSDRYERAEDLAGLVGAFAAIASTWTQFDRIHPPSDWEGNTELAFHLPFVLAVLVGGWIAGAVVAHYWPWLKRLFVPRKTMAARVFLATNFAFDRYHVRGTSGRTGIVIYLSLFERRVCILGDTTIASKIQESQWKEVCEGLVKALGQGKAREGMVEAVRRCGELLATHFPIQKGDVNELSNELRILD